MAIKSKGKHKSGGVRIITYLVTDNEKVTLLTITTYDKQVKDNISEKEFTELLDDLEQTTKPSF